MKQVEDEQNHRHTMERRMLAAEIVDTIGGKLLGAVMTVVAIGACVWSVQLGAHWSVSVAIVSVPITALIGKFISRKD